MKKVVIHMMLTIVCMAYRVVFFMLSISSRG